MSATRPLLAFAVRLRIGPGRLTLWLLERPTVLWSNTASMVVEPAWRMVPPLSVTLFAFTPIPLTAASVTLIV